MKKIVLFIFAFINAFDSAFGQVTTLVEAPLNNGSTTQVRAPNGTSTFAYHRACALVLQSDLTGIAPGTTITSFGYTLTAGASMPVAGNFTVYLENTTNTTYLKGTNWATAITGMTSVYASVMTIPASVGTASILITLSSPFVYTGGGIYVATDWFSPGPYSTVSATFYAENGTTLNPGCASANSGTSPAPTALSTTAFRPSFLFGFSNPYTNDIQVIGVVAPGKVPFIFNTAHNIIGVIKNASNITQTNITASLNVTGANPFSNTQLIANLAAGAVTSVTFSSYNPLIPGANTISVSVAPDQNNTNNSVSYSQSVTCSTFAQNPAAGVYTTGIGFNGPGIILSKFSNPVTSTLTGINFGISNDVNSINGLGCGILMNATGSIIATTNTITLTSLMLGTVQNFQFTPFQNLSPGTTYYIGLAQLSAGYPAGALNYPYVIPNTYFSSGINGGVLTPIGSNFGYFSIEAVFSPTISASVSPSVTCSGSTATLSVNGPSSYTWRQGLTVIGTNQNTTVAPLVSTLYSVVGSNTLGCSFFASVSLSVNPQPVVSAISNTNALCLGDAFSLALTGALNYSLNGTAAAQITTLAPTSNSNYTILGIDANGCVNTTSIGITVFSLTVTFPPNYIICSGKTVTLSASSPFSYNYNWTNGVNNLAFPSIIITPSVSTSFTVTATDNNNCSLSSSVSITVNSNPTVSAVASKSVICKGESVTLTANGATTYTWNNAVNGASITLSPATNTVYFLSGANASGCTNSISIQQLVAPCTALDEQNATALRIKIFPNPNIGLFSLVSESFNKTQSVEIYSLLGALVKRIELNSESTNIDLGDEPRGIYIIRLVENKTILFTTKMVKE
jgi:hypothetical protein